MARPRCTLKTQSLICYRLQLLEGGENVATKKSKTYTVTFSPSENVYSETQLLKSIYESLYAVANAENQEAVNTAPIPETGVQMKGDST